LIEHVDTSLFIWHHEDITIGTVIRAQPATDAVILDDNLQVLAAMDRVHRTADHAMRIGARAAGGANEEVLEAETVPEHARDGHAVRYSAVLLNAALGAFVASRAKIHVEHEKAPAFVETLLDIIAEQCIALGVTPKTRK